MSMQTIKYVASYFYVKICVILQQQRKQICFSQKENIQQSLLKFTKCLKFTSKQNYLIFLQPFFLFSMYRFPPIFTYTRIFIYFYFYLFQFLFFIHHLRTRSKSSFWKLFILVLFFLPFIFFSWTWNKDWGGYCCWLWSCLLFKLMKIYQIFLTSISLWRRRKATRNKSSNNAYLIKSH